MKVLVVCCAIGAIGLGFTAPALAEPPTLKLADIVAVAVKQSPDLASARVDVDAAAADLLRSRGIEDVHVGAQLQYVRNLAQPTDPFDLERLHQEQAQVSLSKEFSTGAIITLAATAGHLIEGVAPIGGIQSDDILGYQSSVTLGITQPLLRGAGGAAVEGLIRHNQQERDAAVLRENARARDVVVNIAIAYWQVALAWRSLEVRQHSLGLAKKQLEFTQGAIRSDKVAQSEALAVQQVIAVRQQDVLAAEEDVVEKSLALRQLAGLEITPDAMEIKTEDLPTITPVEFDLGKIVGSVFDESAELAALDADTRAAKADLAAAEAAARPRLDLQVTAGPQGTDDTFKKSVSDMVNFAGYAISAGLVFDQTIQRRTERGTEAQAHASIVKAEVAARTARAKIAVTATQTVQRARAALSTIALGERTISLAEQNITAEQHKFELAKSTNFEVLRRQDELEQARLRYASAVVDFLTARATLDGLTGTVLQQFGIVIK